MYGVDINWGAIVVSALINMAIGSLWYSPVLFYKPWSKLAGLSLDQTGKNSKRNVGYGVAMLSALVQAFVLNYFIRNVGATTGTAGMIVGLWAWVGLVATVLAMNYVFAGRPLKLYYIDAFYYLVVLLTTGALLAVWQ